MKNDMKAAVSPMEMDVRIFPYRGDGPVAAIASVTLNGCFAVRDVRIMEGKNGLFVSMPSRKVKGEYQQKCSPDPAFLWQPQRRCPWNRYLSYPQLGPWRHGGWYYLRRQYAHRIPAYVWRKHRQYQLWQFWRIQYLWRLYLCDR